MHPRACPLLHSGDAGATPSRRHRRSLLAVLLALAGLAAPAAAHAQPAGLRIARINADALPDLKVYLTYLGADGKSIGDRAPASFKLMVDAADNATATALVPFAKLNEPLSVVLLAPVAAAVNPALLSELKTGFGKLSQAVAAYPGSRLSVLTFGATTKKLLAAGGAAEATAALANLKVSDNDAESHLLEGLQAGLDLLKAQGDGRRKLIVVVTDGIDVSRDKRSFSELGRRAQEAGVIIDTIGFSEFDSAPLRNLPEITKRCYGASRVAKTLADVGVQLDAVLEEIQKQYAATFRLNLAGDDKEHVIQVVDTAAATPVYSNVITVRANPPKPQRPIILPAT